MMVFCNFSISLIHVDVSILLAESREQTYHDIEHAVKTQTDSRVMAKMR